MRIGEIEREAGVESRFIREWARDQLIPEAHKERASRGERKDYEFREGSVERVVAVATFLWDVSFSREELRSMFDKVPLPVLSEKLRTLPFHRFLAFLREEGVHVDDARSLDRFVGGAKKSKPSRG